MISYVPLCKITHCSPDLYMAFISQFYCSSAKKYDKYKETLEIICL
jgi:hypothetical protein